MPTNRTDRHRQLDAGGAKTEYISSRPPPTTKSPTHVKQPFLQPPSFVPQTRADGDASHLVLRYMQELLQHTLDGFGRRARRVDGEVPLGRGVRGGLVDRRESSRAERQVSYEAEEAKRCRANKSACAGNSSTTSPSGRICRTGYDEALHPARGEVCEVDAHAQCRQGSKAKWTAAVRRSFLPMRANQRSTPARFSDRERVDA